MIDVAPTILEAAGLPEPTMVNGVQQSPMEGTSMLYTFNDADAPERHDLQYFEMFANRGIYHKGWSAVTKHRTPWVMVGGELPAFDDDVWELYDGSSDYSQARNLAAEQPEMLAKLQRLWLIEATKYNVLPMDDRTAERLEPTMAGRPTLIRGNSQLFFPGMGRLSENSVVSIKNKSFSVTAEVDVPDGGAEGVIIAQGGRFGGWAVYAKDGKAKFVYNVLGIQEFATEADEPIPAGTHQVRMEFAYDGGGLAKGGDVTLYYDGNAVGTGRVGATQPMIFSADETTDIGYESGTTVTPDYTAHGSRFTGKINWVQIDLGTDDHDHFIDPEERPPKNTGPRTTTTQETTPPTGAPEDSAKGEGESGVKQQQHKTHGRAGRRPGASTTSSRWDGARVLVVGHVATRWALDHLAGGQSLEDLVDADFAWQPGWRYRWRRDRDGAPMPGMAITGAHALLYTSEPEAVRAIFRDVLGFDHVNAGEAGSSSPSPGRAGRPPGRGTRSTAADTAVPHVRRHRGGDGRRPAGAKASTSPASPRTRATASRPRSCCPAAWT